MIVDTNLTPKTKRQINLTSLIVSYCISESSSRRLRVLLFMAAW